MIESSVNQVALQQKQASIADVATAQHAQEARRVEKTAEEASSNPVTQHGAPNSSVQATPVSSQPADVVTRLGESQESPSLYQPTHQATGKIIRPDIKNENTAEQIHATTDVNNTTTNNTQVATSGQSNESATVTNPKSWATDTNQLLGS